MKKIRFLIFISIIIGTICIPIISIDDVNNVKGQEQLNNEQAQFTLINDNISLIFELKEVYKYKKPLEYKIKYPIFNNKDIENKINDKIKNLANDFKNEFAQYEPIMEEEKFIFNLNAEVYILKDKLLFVKFSVNRNYNTYPNPVKFFETYIMDINTGEFLETKNILNKGYEDLFYLYAKEYFFNNYGLNITKQSENYNDIKPDKDIYNKIFVKENYLEVFLYDYKKQEEIFINIPFDKIISYINKKYIEIPTVTTDLLTITTTLETTQESTTEATQESTTVTTTEQTMKLEKKPSNKRIIDKNKPMIALTFDDGPNGAKTDKILDILEKNNSVATFFIVARRMETDSKILKRMDSLGNQIGNHTANHKDLTKISKTQIKSEIAIVNDKLKKIIGKESSMVRVPYGATNDSVKQTVDYPIVMWSVDTRDWQSKNVKAIEQKVLGKVKDGDIILMHDLYDTTAQACEIIIPKLIEQGFQLVTVEELLQYKGIEAKKGTKIFNAIKK